MADQPSDRKSRAERYFAQDLKGQREWYGKRALAYKNYTHILGFVLIAGGQQPRSCKSSLPRRGSRQ